MINMNDRNTREEYYTFKPLLDITPDVNALNLNRVKKFQFEHAMYQFSRVLDIGCKDGFASRWLLEDTDVELVVGIDLCGEAIDYCREANLYGSRAEYLQVPAKEYLENFQGGEFFDCIIAFEVIEHLPSADGEELLRLIHSRLAPGGMGFVTTPDKAGIYGDSNDDPEHIYLYTEGQLRASIALATQRLAEIEADGDSLMATWRK